MIIILVLAGVILLVYFVGSRIWRECMALIQNLPDLYEELETGLRQIGDNLNVVFERLPEAVQNAWYQMIDNLDQAMGALMQQISEPTVTAASNFVKRIPSILIGFIVTIISAYFFIAEREMVIEWAKKVSPDPIVRRILKRSLRSCL